ncbi:MAG: hypothetical protein Q7J80_02465 [Anaerolineales bacterium]|nr:hypothetical protein [Anaerolineales bacterium]
MKKRTLFLTITALLAGSYTVAQVASRSNETTTPVAEPNKPCYYNWAYQDLPELSVAFESSVQAEDSNATAHATAYGEDCIAADGTSIFGALETDFYVQLPVQDLSDFESFGNWIAQVMKIIEGLPADMMEGPQDGFVEFRFEKNENDSLFVRVPIGEYREKAIGLSGVELFEIFYRAP